jgi:hypothetical protein
MWADVVDLNEFYSSRLGQVARRMIRRRIRSIWPDVRGMSVLGLGYATPYLRIFRDEAERVLAVMPAHQGVMRWPPVDRLIMVHAAEHSEHLRDMMREAWRVLTGSGRMIVIVPNRRGIWARFERTPFGQGHPYSQGQLRRLLQDCLFTPVGATRALYIPPTRLRIVLHSASALENIGDRWFQAVSGVVMIEASKQIYAATAVQAEPARKRRPFVAITGGGRPS